MNTIGGERLRWMQLKGWSRTYELYDGSMVLATLRWTKLLGSMAEAEIGGGRYTLKRGGFLHSYVTLRRAEFEDDIAKVRMSLRGSGSLEFMDGKRYALQKKSVWHQRWSFVNENGEQLLEFYLQPQLMRQNGEISISDEGRRDAHLSMLLIIGWFIVLLVAQEQQSAAATASTS